LMALVKWGSTTNSFLEGLQATCLLQCIHLRGGVLARGATAGVTNNSVHL